MFLLTSVSRISCANTSGGFELPRSINFETFLTKIRKQFDELDEYERVSFLSTLCRFLTSKKNARELLEAYAEGLDKRSDYQYKGERYEDIYPDVDTYNFNKLNRLGRAFVLITSSFENFIDLSEEQVRYLKSAFQEAVSEVLNDYVETVTANS